MRLDIWLAKPGVAIELKYRTRKLEIEHNCESFHLRNLSDKRSPLLERAYSQGHG